MSVIKRLEKELKNINSDETCNFTAGIRDNNIFSWEVTLIGEKDTPYHSGIFKLHIDFPQDYPFQPPRCNFVTKIYHSNINSAGSICLDILKDQWSPSLNISKLLLSILSLMSDPNPKDALVPEIGELFLTNRQQHDANAMEYTFKYAN